MQHSLIFIEQNPIDIRKIHVPCANLGTGQATTAKEGITFDAGNAIRDRDAR